LGVSTSEGVASRNASLSSDSDSIYPVSESGFTVTSDDARIKEEDGLVLGSGVARLISFVSVSGPLDAVSNKDASGMTPDSATLAELPVSLSDPVTAGLESRDGVVASVSSSVDSELTGTPAASAVCASR